MKPSCLSSRAPVGLFVCCLLASCGKHSALTGAENALTDSPDGGSPAADITAQAALVTTQMDTVVQALAEGGPGGGGSGGTGAGLTSTHRDNLAISQTCSTSPTQASTALNSPDGNQTWTLPAGSGVVSLRTKYSGVMGNKAWESNEDGSEPGSVETWYPGPYFGMANISADSGSTWGTLTSAGVPAVTPVSGAPTGSSGQLGSVGFRSADGSWTGAPVWEVGTGYVGWVSSAKLISTFTQGMTVYLAGHTPAVTALSPAPPRGGTPGTVQLVPASLANGQTPTSSQLTFAVLGKANNGILPSFQSTGTSPQVATVAAGGIPARIYNPPSSLSCAADGKTPVVGWKFSQNVANFTRVSQIRTTASHSFKRHTSRVSAQLNRQITHSDPALVAPVTSQPSQPYFDENAGTLTLTHTLGVGSQASPNQTTTSVTLATGSTKPTITNMVYTSVPFTVTTTRSLLDPSWPWVSKTVSSGALTTSSGQSGQTPVSTTLSSFQDVVFQNRGTASASCLPVSGVITHRITPADPALAAITYTVRFGTSISKGVSSSSGVTVQVSCSGGAFGASNCTQAGETDDDDHTPTGCNF